MGTNTLTPRTDGESIPAADHNEILEALSIDFVPRNNARQAVDLVGQLGRSDFRWLRAFVKEYFIGTSANNLKIYEDAGKIVVENGSTLDVVKAELTTTGLSLYRNGVVFCSFDSTTFSSIPNYIPASALKTKVNVFSGNYSTSDLHGSFTTVYTRVLTGLTVGKKLKWVDSGTVGRLVSSNQSAKARWLVNGSSIFQINQQSTPPAAGGSWSFGGNHLVTITATTMTLVLQTESTNLRAGSYLVEEV